MLKQREKKNHISMQVIVSKALEHTITCTCNINIIYKQLPVFATQFNKRTPALFILRIWNSFQKACNETLDLTDKSKDFL